MSETLLKEYARAYINISPLVTCGTGALLQIPVVEIVACMDVNKVHSLLYGTVTQSSR